MSICYASIWPPKLRVPPREQEEIPFFPGIDPAWAGWRGISSKDAGPFFFSIFFTSIWLWLYAGSGFLLKAARRFDIGFQWFNRHFDTEKKPLKSIGLVAGAIVAAVVYWGAVVVIRLV